jgi:PEP-CTERM motif
MAKQFLATVFGAAALGVMVLASPAQAGPMTHTIGIKFGADEPSGTNGSVLLPTDIAGVPAARTANWNNAFGASGTIGPPGPAFLMRDDFGIATTTGTSVMWTASNTWTTQGRGEDSNNNFIPNTPDWKLMRGYLDENAVPGTVNIKVSNLPPDFARYDVYVYFLDSVAGRFGDYTVNGITVHNLPANTGPVFNGPAYVQAVGDNSPGNFLLFAGLTDSTITITANNAPDTRAGISAIEIVAEAPLPPPIPEPTSLALVGIGLAGLLAYGWRRRARA